MPKPLRGDEIPACVHRVALNRGGPTPLERPAPSPEMAKRRRDAEAHRRATLEDLAAHHPEARTARGPDETRDLIARGVAVILSPGPLADPGAGRVASLQALIRVGRVDEAFAYAPVLVKNSEVVEAAPTRRILEGTLASPAPGEAVYHEGLTARSSLSVVRAGLSLSHATRVLQALGAGDPGARGAVVDRHRRVWWFDLVGGAYPRFNLAAYDALYEERRGVLDAHERWRAGTDAYPTAPYWHRECLECPYHDTCETQLEAHDDVSLTRFTSLDQQILLREHGVATRADLARLDPARARAARARVLTTHVELAPEDHLGRAIDKLDDLIYRARAHARATSLRTRDPGAMGCPTADLEVDVDMESNGDATYLWGALVTARDATGALDEGYHSFAEWGALDAAAEARLFARFWSWFDALRERTRARGATFAAYCFWAQAEDGAMNRAVAAALPDGPSAADLDAFRATRPTQWVDLHEQVQRQIQTEGPYGLKHLAGAAGFHWRDAHPSGEASMAWYEEAVSGGANAPGARRRLLEYNEDDCRATRALRAWLNGPARDLPHRDDPL